MGASSFTDTKAREKVVNFVDYANVGESFYTKLAAARRSGASPTSVARPSRLKSGTTEQTDAKTQGGKCTKAGKPDVTARVLDSDRANLAVSSGRAQLGFADTPVADYQVKKSGGTFKITGAAYAPSPYGLAIPKGPLDRAVLAALKVLVSERHLLGKIFAKWGLQGVEIPASGVKINGATS